MLLIYKISPIVIYLLISEVDRIRAKIQQTYKIQQLLNLVSRRIAPEQGSETRRRMPDPLYI